MRNKLIYFFKRGGVAWGEGSSNKIKAEKFMSRYIIIQMVKTEEKGKSLQSSYIEIIRYSMQPERETTLFKFWRK